MPGHTKEITSVKRANLCPSILEKIVCPMTRADLGETLFCPEDWRLLDVLHQKNKGKLKMVIDLQHQQDRGKAVETMMTQHPKGNSNFVTDFRAFGEAGRCMRPRWDKRNVAEARH